MHALALAILLAAPAVESRQTGLPSYMMALDDLLTRRRRIVELVVQQRIDEARRLAAIPLPPVLGDDWQVLPQPFPQPRPGDPAESAASLANFALNLGVADLAAPLLERAIERGGAVNGAFDRVHTDLLTAGNIAVARSWAAAHPRPGHEERTRRYNEKGALDPWGGSPEARASRALSLWKGRRGPADQALLDRLANLLPSHGRRLVWESAVSRRGASPKDVARQLRRLAEAGTRSEAHSAWSRLAAARVSPFETASAWHELAMLELDAGRPDQALPLLQRAIRTSAETAPYAQWDLGHAQYMAANYQEALDAWRRSETVWPRLACCGDSFTTDYALWQGLALDHQGRQAEAVTHYLVAIKDPRIAARLLDLYERAGQFEDVVRLFDETAPRSPAAYEDMVPSLSMLVLRRMARAEDWPSLVAHAMTAQDDLFESAPQSRDGRAVGREAIRLLGRNCDAATPLLLEALTQGKPGTPRYGLIRALGECARPSGIDALVARAAKEQNIPNSIPRRALEITSIGRSALGAHGVNKETAMKPTRDWRWRIEFPPSNAKSLPARPTPADHTPKAFRGAQSGCVCM